MKRFLLLIALTFLAFNISCKKNTASPNDDSTVTDTDGNVYETVTIGDQVWMAENLKVTHYRNGDEISNVIDNEDWFNITTGAYCSFNNDDSNIDTYGLLYNWYAVSDSRDLAPLGWHIPTDEEWKKLEIFIGMSQTEADDTSYRGTDEGGKLKETSTTHWLSPNEGATNSSGFSALPGGYLLSNGFFGLGTYGAWWSSSTEDSNDHAWHRYLYYYTSDIYRNPSHKEDGFSVRCVKD